MKKSYENSYHKGLQDLCSYPNTNSHQIHSTVHDSQNLWYYCKALKTYTHRHNNKSVKTVRGNYREQSSLHTRKGLQSLWLHRMKQNPQRNKMV